MCYNTEHVILVSNANDVIAYGAHMLEMSLTYVYNSYARTMISMCKEKGYEDPREDYWIENQQIHFICDCFFKQYKLFFSYIIFQLIYDLR